MNATGAAHKYNYPFSLKCSKITHSTWRRSKKEKLKKGHGTCAYERSNPKEGDLSNTQILNVFVPFVEALKLNLAIDQCVRKLHGIKKSTTLGKRAALIIAIHLKGKSISIHEGRTAK
jgi:hypothetical protein